MIKKIYDKKIFIIFLIFGGNVFDGQKKKLVRQGFTLLFFKKNIILFSFKKEVK